MTYGCDNWVIHDLRSVVRLEARIAQSAGHHCRACIGHGKKGLQRVYDQHSYEAEIREALELWAGLLRDIVKPPPANVVRLPKERA